MSYPFAVRFEGPHCSVEWYRNATRDGRMYTSPEQEWQFPGGWAIYAEGGTVALDGWWDTKGQAIEAMHKKYGKPINYPPPRREPESVIAELRGREMAYYRGWWGAEYIVFPPSRMDRGTRMPGVTIGEHGDYEVRHFWSADICDDRAELVGDPRAVPRMAALLRWYAAIAPVSMRARRLLGM